MSMLMNAPCLEDEVVLYTVFEGDTVYLTGKSDVGVLTERRDECEVPRFALGLAPIERVYEPQPLHHSVISITETWRYYIELDIDDFENLNDVNLVLAIIAKESGGQADAINMSPNGNADVGLMQVTPRSWTATQEDLLMPRYNIWTGMWLLDNILDKTDGDIRYALAAYNCGFVKVDADKCGAGGYNYADDILNNILPVFQERVQ